MMLLRGFKYSSNNQSGMCVIYSQIMLKELYICLMLKRKMIRKYIVYLQLYCVQMWYLGWKVWKILPYALKKYKYAYQDCERGRG